VGTLLEENVRFRVTLQGRLVSDTAAVIDDDAVESLRAAFGKLNGLGAFPGNAYLFVNSATGALKIECNADGDDAIDAIANAGQYIKLALESGGIEVPSIPSHNHRAWTVEFMGEASAVPLLLAA
jgi:hypothetical protein